MSHKLLNQIFLKDISYQLLLFLHKQTSKNMSKSAFPVKQNKIKIKSKSTFPPGIVKFQVLGSGANGAPRCLYLFTDHSRYLFNCGEGTQRLAHEHKMKLSKLEHVFITHSNWLNIGGLPGLALTVQDVGVPKIELHGPQGIEELFIATKRFVVLRDLKISASKSEPFKPYEDNAIIVNYVPLISNKRNESRSMSEDSIINNSNNQQNMNILLDDETNYYDYENITQTNKKEKKKRKRSNSESRTDEKKFIADSPVNRINNIAMSYVCHLKPKPGFLDLDECVKHNVPPGPLLGLLKSGKDIILPDGTLVKSSDVTAPDDPGPVFIVIECPSEDYIDSLLNQSIFSKHQQEIINKDNIAFMVVHFTPQEVRNNPRYQLWMKLFPPETYHLLLNNENKCLGSTAIHRIQYKLNMLDDTIYPLLEDKGIPIIGNDRQVIINDKNSNINSLMINGQTNLIFNLRPKKNIDRTSTLNLDINEFITETFKVDGFKEKLVEVKRNILNTVPTDSNIYPKITFLGTGSCIPSKTRNTSGILMYTGENECILLDSGEGTYGQLVRHFGLTRSEKVLRDLKAIYVSHLHADHHIGLIGILSVRQKMRVNGLFNSDQPIYLLAPVQIMTWLNFYHRRFAELNEEFKIVSNLDLDFKSSTKLMIDKNLLKQTNMSDIGTTLVMHCPNAFGVSFTHINGWKVTYSGDTMPCDSLVKLGKNSNLLIHEATMEDQLVFEARRKMHSTMSQAINIGKKMNAKFTILTHFSQRYAKIPYMPNDDLPSNVGIAFDNMEIAPNVLHKLPLMYPALKMIFAEHFEEMEAKCIKLKLKEEKAQVKI